MKTIKIIIAIIIAWISLYVWIPSNYIIIKREPNVYWQRMQYVWHCWQWKEWLDPFEFYIDKDGKVSEWVNCSKNNWTRKNAIYDYLKEHKENPTIWYGADGKWTNEWDYWNE